MGRPSDVILRAEIGQKGRELIEDWIEECGNDRSDSGSSEGEGHGEG